MAQGGAGNFTFFFFNIALVASLVVVSYALKDNLFGRILLSELNLKATVRVNGQQGIRFRVFR